MKENNKYCFSLNMKKNIVLAVCSLVLMATMGISLWKQSPKEEITQDETVSVDFVGKNMEETSTATNLYMNYAEVEQENSSEEIGESSEGENEISEKKEDVAVADGPDESKSGMVVSSDDKKDASREKKTSKSPSVTYQEVSEPAVKSGPKKSGKSQNRVVDDASKTGKSKGNRVVENPEPSNYIEKVFENHGIAPVIGELLRKYQYPVEIGYSYDKNYDGNNNAGDFILNKVFDTKEYEEESAEEESEKDSEMEDAKKTEKDSDEPERDEESDQAEESQNDEENSKVTDGSQTDEKNSHEEEDSENEQEDDLNNEISGDAVVEQETDSEDVQNSTVSGDAVSDEQKKLEEYRKDIWKQIMPTAPVDVEIEKKVMKTTPVDKSEKKENSVTEDTSKHEGADETSESPKQASGDAKETTEESSEEPAQEDGSRDTSETTDGEGDVTETVSEEMASGDAAPIVETESVAGYYIIKGKMREGSKVYVSDITILPVGVDGFDKIRLGKDGEFKDSIVLTTDVMNRTIELYFTDGETVTEPTTFTYSKDTVTPELQWMEEEYTLLESAQRKIYCTKENQLPVKVFDGEENEGATLESVQYLYGTKLQSVAEGLESPKLSMNEDFYGRLLISCRDKAGNTSDIQSQFVLVDHNEPVIQFAQDERCSAPYSLWVNVEEAGHIVSGVQTIQCTVDGNSYEISDLKVRETYTLDEGLEVSSKLTFPVELTETGNHMVSVLVRDYAGNETVVEQIIEVTEPELVSIYMPKNFTIHIDPQQLAGKEQIYSDNVELKNVGKFDVCVNIDKVVLNVKDEVSAEGVLKDCDIYLIAPDTGEKIKLSKGENENIYSYRLPVDAVGDLANLRFVGTTTAGSERMWKGSDISLSLQVSFVKWEEE